MKLESPLGTVRVLIAKEGWVEWRLGIDPEGAQIREAWSFRRRHLVGGN